MSLQEKVYEMHSQGYRHDHIAKVLGIKQTYSRVLLSIERQLRNDQPVIEKKAPALISYAGAN
jgi:hypothetical protein